MLVLKKKKTFKAMMLAFVIHLISNKYIANQLYVSEMDNFSVNYLSVNCNNK